MTVLDFLTFVIVRLHLFNRRERGGRRGFSNIEIAVFQTISKFKCSNGDKALPSGAEVHPFGDELHPPLCEGFPYIPTIMQSCNHSISFNLTSLSYLTIFSASHLSSLPPGHRRQNKRDNFITILLHKKNDSPYSLC